MRYKGVTQPEMQEDIPPVNKVIILLSLQFLRFDVI